MATLYWGGGTGTWSSTDKTHWYTDLARTILAANAPTSADDVIFDSTSNATAYTVTISTGAVCLSCTIAGPASGNMTLAGTATWTIYGNLTLPATGLTRTFTGQINFYGTGSQTITTNGVALASWIYTLGTGTYTLQDALNNSNQISHTKGTFDTNGKTLTCASIFASSLNTKTLTFGSSTVNINFLQLDDKTTLNASSSNINITSSFGGISNGLGFTGGTFKDLTYSVAVTTPYIGGVNTFNNVTITSPTATGFGYLKVYSDQTINGTLALGGGTSVTQRFGVFSDTVGTQRTITAATVTGLTDIDFRDIKGAGAGTWTGGTRIGDCGGNSGIGFTAARTVYWNLAGTNNWSATAWTTTASGGTPAANDFPLAQDTVVFDDNNTVGTVTINAAWNIGTISAGNRTSAMTFSGTGAPFIYGDVTYGSGVTANYSGTYNFNGRGTQTFTTAGKSLGSGITVSKPSGTFQHGDAYTSSVSSNAIIVQQGSYTTQNYNITVANFNSNYSNTRSITFGTSVLTLSADSNVFQLGNIAIPASLSTLTFSGASSTINLSSTSAKTFNGTNQTFGTLCSTGGTTNALTITGSNTFGTLTNTAYTYLKFTSGTTQTVTNFNYSGAAGNVVNWTSTTAGSRATIKQSPTGGSLAAVGANSTDGGNNSGLTFTGTFPDYLYVKDIAYQAAYNGGPNFFLLF